MIRCKCGREYDSLDDWRTHKAIVGNDIWLGSNHKHDGYIEMEDGKEVKRVGM